MPTLTIDGREIEVAQGMTVLQACELAGVDVPRFCYHDKLAIAGRHGTGGDRLRRAFQFDQAHAAIAGHRQTVVIAKARHLDTGRFAGLQHRHAGVNRNFLAVDAKRGHGGSSGSGRGPGLGPRPQPLLCQDTAFDLGPEVADQTLNGPGRGIAQGANRMALDLLGHFQ